MKKFFLIIWISIIAVSCQENEPIPNTGNKLTAIYSDDIKFYEFEYNAEGLLKAEKSKYFFYSYSYDKRAMIVSKEVYWDQRVASSNSNTAQEAWSRPDWVNPENTDLSGTLVFEFDSNNLLMKSTELIGYSEYKYDSEGRLTARHMYHEGKLSGIREFRYDLRGNISEDSHYFILENGTRQLASVTEYEYDQMKNPFYNLRPDRFPVGNLNPNNITREKYTVSGFPNGGYDRQYTYEYNDLGFPARRNDGQSFRYSQ